MSNKSVEERLKELGVELPVVPKLVAEYVPADWVGDLVNVSGQRSTCDGKPVSYVGQVGGKVSPDEAYKAAQICALNCLAIIGNKGEKLLV